MTKGAEERGSDVKILNEDAYGIIRISSWCLFNNLCTRALGEEKKGETASLVGARAAREKQEEEAGKAGRKGGMSFRM